MKLFKLAAFAHGDKGGNPAGVVLEEPDFDDDRMQHIAAELGYSETAFSYPIDGRWRTRYFAPEGEVPFCGHATVALGAVLAQEYGVGAYELELNQEIITVEGAREGRGWRGRLQSPATTYRDPGPALEEALAIFPVEEGDLSTAFAPVIAMAGATHLILPVASRGVLKDCMGYDLTAGKDLMRKHGLTTIMFVHERSQGQFDARNAFASGGVIEDPATGAAAAAFAGFLRDGLHRPDRRITIVQGEDMGMDSLIEVEIPEKAGIGIWLSGATRAL